MGGTICEQIFRGESLESAFDGIYVHSGSGVPTVHGLRPEQAGVLDPSQAATRPSTGKRRR
jgi:hypothetical protein